MSRAAPFCHVAADNLACVRGGRMLFAKLAFTVASGEILHITGPNGIGKSSLIRMLAGLLPPFAGQLNIAGDRALSDERLALDLHWPLARTLQFWAKLDGASPAKVDTAMAQLGLAVLADVPVRLFSTGQRKRAGLARMLASGAPIWLMDEPVNGLDNASAAMLGAAMSAHLAEGGAIVAASHQPLPIVPPHSLDLADYYA